MSEPDNNLFIDRLRLVRGMIRARAEQEQREIAAYMQATGGTGSEVYNTPKQRHAWKYSLTSHTKIHAKNLRKRKPFLTAADLILLREMKIGL